MQIEREGKIYILTNEEIEAAYNSYCETHTQTNNSELGCDSVLHICSMPGGATARIWVGDDLQKYVDHDCEYSFLTAIRSWFEKYQKVKEEDWKEFYPSDARARMLRLLRGSCSGDALEILTKYLPCTGEADLYESVLQMIQMWEEKQPITPTDEKSYDIPLWKKLVLEGKGNKWSSHPLSRYERMAYDTAAAECVMYDCKKLGITPEECVKEKPAWDDEKRKRVLRICAEMASSEET